jgi:MFS family permease
MSRAADSIETRASWIAATAALVVMSVAFGAPYVAVVALKPMAAEFGGARTVPALCYSFVWLGTAVGGVALGPLAERIGLRWTAMAGTVMAAAGLVLSSRSEGIAGLYLGHGLLIGVLGLGGINAPIYVYISRWFDRRRGTALALISSGLYIAGAVWPPLFEPMIARLGWRETMVIFAAIDAAIVLPTAFFFFDPPPAPVAASVAMAGAARRGTILGLSPNLALTLISVASFFCCVTMAMPQGHLIALCSDLGIAPETGAAMLSVLLGTAFVSRQFWGFVSDRIGGLRTLVAGSVCQAAAVAAFLFTQDEAGLFTVSAFFGFGFSGLIPAYVLTIRELFPASEAGWRVPVMMLLSGSGMAAGGWLAGALYDRFGFYGAAFAAGLMANLVNFGILAFLATRGWRGGDLRAVPAAT